MEVEIEDVVGLTYIIRQRFGGMEHHAFRIFGLDTSFTGSEETYIAEAPQQTSKKRHKSAPLPLDAELPASVQGARVTVRLAELLPLLIDATQRNRAWIRDFGDDEITVSEDLYEVALAYRSMGRAA